MALHIYNAVAIKDEIKRNKNERNLYEKINDILKGATIKNRDLAKEVVEIISRENRDTCKKLAASYGLTSDSEAEKKGDPITVLVSNLA